MVHKVCAVLNCKSTSKLNTRLAFHRFPTDERYKIWIESCRRPELYKKRLDQLRNVYVCSLHFIRRMVFKKRLKSCALPILNLPSKSIHSIGTQTLQIMENDQGQFFSKEVTKSPNNRHSAQNTDNLTPDGKENGNLKRKTEAISTCSKKLKTSEDISVSTASEHQARKIFLEECDKYLPPHLSEIVKFHVKSNSKNYTTTCSKIGESSSPNSQIEEISTPDVNNEEHSTPDVKIKEESKPDVKIEEDFTPDVEPEEDCTPESPDVETEEDSTPDVKTEVEDDFEQNFNIEFEASPEHYQPESP